MEFTAEPESSSISASEEEAVISEENGNGLSRVCVQHALWRRRFWSVA